MASLFSPPTQTMKDSPIFFYRPKASPHSYLSQWYPSPFTNPNTKTSYTTAEQYMMHGKATLFTHPSNAPIASQILATSSPKLQKSLGRKVQNFSQEIWGRERERIVEEGTYLKFKYGVDEGELRNEGKCLRERLLETGDRELVEASPMDRVWGVGFGEKNAEKRRKDWGLNLLGKCLMRVRERLRTEKEEEDVKVAEKEEVAKGSAIEVQKGKEAEEKDTEKKLEVANGKEAKIQTVKKSTGSQIEDERPKKRARRGKA